MACGSTQTCSTPDDRAEFSCALWDGEAPQARDDGENGLASIKLTAVVRNTPCEILYEGDGPEEVVIPSAYIAKNGYKKSST